MNIRDDVVTAVREPTFTIRRNTCTEPRWRLTDASGRVIATGKMRLPRMCEPTDLVTFTRRSDPVALSLWGKP